MAAISLTNGKWKFPVQIYPHSSPLPFGPFKEHQLPHVRQESCCLLDREMEESPHFHLPQGKKLPILAPDTEISSTSLWSH